MHSKGYLRGYKRPVNINRFFCGLRPVWLQSFSSHKTRLPNTTNFWMAFPFRKDLTLCRGLQNCSLPLGLTIMPIIGYDPIRIWRCLKIPDVFRSCQVVVSWDAEPPSTSISNTWCLQIFSDCKICRESGDLSRPKFHLQPSSDGLIWDMIPAYPILPLLMSSLSLPSLLPPIYIPLWAT